MAPHYDLELHQIGVKIVFLNGNLDEKVFMDQAEGYMVEEKNRMVYKLKKLVYELE